MGTAIISEEDCRTTNTNLMVKRFWGGKIRGTCYGFYKRVGGIALEITEKEMEYLIYKVLKNQYDEIADKDTLYSGHIEFLRVIHPFLSYCKEKYENSQ